MEPTLEQIFGSYTAWEAKEGTWFINFMNGSENMYLLEGMRGASDRYRIWRGKSSCICRETDG